MKNRKLCMVCFAFAIVFGLLVYLFGGYFLPSLKENQVQKSFAEQDTVSVKGCLYQKEEKENYSIYYLKDVIIQSSETIQNSNSYVKESKILIYDETMKNPALGQQIKAWGEIHFFEADRNPGNFNQKLYYQKMNIHCSVWASAVKTENVNTEAIKTEIEESSASSQKNSRNVERKDYRTFYWNFRNRLYAFRSLLEKTAYLYMDESSASTLNAMVLGDRGNMDTDVKALYQAGGISHVLSISGLHLSFLVLGVYEFLRSRSGSFKRAGVGGILFLFSYICIAGLGVSIIRAAVMFLFRVGADLTGRSYDSLTALAAALVIVFLWRPLSVVDAGFYLSFGAVLAVILVAPAFQGLFDLDFLEGFLMSLSIFLVTVPILLRSYFEIPLYSLALNIVVIPLMSGVLFLGVAGEIFSLLFWPLGKICLIFCQLILKLFELLCQWSLKLPAAKLVLGKPSLFAVFLYYAAFGMGLYLWHLYKKEKGFVSRGQIGKSLLLLAMVCILSMTIHIHGPGSMEITLVDIGQGDCIYIRGPSGKNYLIDAGSSTVSNVAQYRLVPFLKSKGIASLDYVFITHGDEDHMNAITEILGNQLLGIKIKNLVLPIEKFWDDTLAELAESANDQGVNVVSINTNQYVSEKNYLGEDLYIYCLQPDMDFDGEPGNAASLILSLEKGKFRMLFTGDVEKEGETALVEKLQKKSQSYDLVKIAHHGSKNSTSDEFLSVTNPKAMLISAGVGNRYGHPSKSTLEKLKEADIPYYCTKYNGAISVYLNRKGKYKITGWIS